LLGEIKIIIREFEERKTYVQAAEEEAVII